jgi:cytochrome c556
MRLATIFAFVFAVCGTGLMAQDDLAKFQEHMKAAGAANGALRKAITDKDVAGVTANVTNMTVAFDWIGDFFKSKGKDDGVTFAMNASAVVKAIADAKTPEDQTAAVAKLGPTCNACHMVYRAGSAFKGL